MTSSNVKPVRRWQRLRRRGRRTSLHSSHAVGIFAASADRPASRQGEQHRTRARFRVVLRCEQGALSNDWGDARSYRSLLRCGWSSRLAQWEFVSLISCVFRPPPASTARPILERVARHVSAAATLRLGHDRNGFAPAHPNLQRRAAPWLLPPDVPRVSMHRAFLGARESIEGANNKGFRRRRRAG